MSEQLSLLLLQTAAIAGILLALFRLRTKLSLSPLYVALGVFQPIQVLLAASVYVELFPGVIVSPGSAVMFTGSLFAVLIVYMREDAREARKVIYALVLSNVVVTGLYLLFDQQMGAEGTRNPMGLPPEIFRVEARVMIVGTVLLLVDSILIIVCYEGFKRIVARPLLARAFVTMAVVLAFDSLAFASGAFLGTEQFGASLFGGLVGKTLTAGVFSAAIHGYFRWVEPVPPGSSEPMRDLFDTLTYREKYAHAREEARRTRDDYLARETAILEAVGDGVLVISAEGEILEVNPAALRLFDCNREEAIGANLASWLHTDEPVWTAREGSGEPLVLHEVRCEGPSGKTALAEVTVTSTQIDDGEVSVVCVHDVTDHHEAEEQRRQTEMLALLGAVAGGVAHDFNNVLTVILGAAAIKKEEAQEEDPELLLIEEAVESAAALTRQLLALGKKGVYSKEHLDAGAVVRKLEGLLTRVTRDSIELSIKTQPEPAWIVADPSQIEQILLNLVVNATRAMPDGGRLDVEVSARERTSVFESMFGELAAGEYVCIEVRDTGKGMAPETIARAFEIFFTTSEAGHGTGLGLTTVRRLVAELEGGLRVESKVGVGTLFEIWLPAAGPSDAPRGCEPAEVVEDRGTACSVLVCDDDYAVGRVSRALLKKAGFEAEFAHGPNEALRMVRSESACFDVLVTDMDMPTMDGRDLAEAIREVLPDIRVVFVSGYFEREDDDELDLDEPLVPKPFTIAKLSKAILSTT